MHFFFIAQIQVLQVRCANTDERVASQKKERPGTKTRGYSSGGGGGLARQREGRGWGVARRRRRVNEETTLKKTTLAWRQDSTAKTV